jgi:hypothetical protein
VYPLRVGRTPGTPGTPGAVGCGDNEGIRIIGMGNSKSKFPSYELSREGGEVLFDFHLISSSLGATWLRFTAYQDIANFTNRGGKFFQWRR